ncbi:MAG: response regulator [Planctomycetaceae bacterium]|nr:response regulator [Planctomycetaceae bacterium]
MNPSLRIVVADDERNMHEYLQEALPRLGHEVVGVAQTGRELIELTRTLLPDLVITDIKMPDLDGLAAAEEICRETPIPIIVVSAYHDPQFIERATQNHVLAYLLKPIRQHDLAPAIGLAMRRFEQFQTLRREATDLRQALDDRKTIERAKGLLMKSEHIDEQEAFRRLQKLAMNQNRKLVEVAQMVLSVSDAFEPRTSK